MKNNFLHFLPNLRQCWWLVFFFAVCGTILSSPIALLFPNSELVKPIGYILSFVPVGLYILFMGKKNIQEAQLSNTLSTPVGFNNPDFGRINPILYFIIIAIALYALNIATDPIYALMKVPDWFEEAINKATRGNIYISTLTVVILAPLCEEFFCRGIMTRGLLKRGYSPAAAVLWSAFFFALIHLNPWQAVPAFIIGCFLGWVYYKTGSLWATIFLHALNNGTTLFLFNRFPEASISDPIKTMLPNPDIFWVLFSIAIGTLALSFFILTKYGKK